MECVSGRIHITNIKFDIAKAVAAQTGSVTLNFESAVPKPGPSKKPSPKATPISPNVLARFSGLDISANMAVAVAAVPPLAPSIILDPNRSNRGILVAHAGKKCCQLIETVNAKRKSPITDPATQIIMTGFLPNRSLKAPIKGATAN